MTSPMQTQDSTPRPAAVPPLDFSGLQAPANSPHNDSRLQSSRRSANSEAPTSASHDEKAQSRPKSRTPSTEYFNIYDQHWHTSTGSLVDDSSLNSHRSVTSAGSMGSWTSSSTYGRRRRAEIDDLRAQISELMSELTELKKTTSPESSKTTSPEKTAQSSADEVPEPKSSSADAQVGLLEQPLSDGANEVAEGSAVEDSSVRYTSRIAERRQKSQNTSDVLKAHIPHQSSRSGLTLLLRYALAISFAFWCSQPKFASQSSSPWRFELDVEICGKHGPGMMVIVADRGLSLECQSAGEEAAMKAQAGAEAAAKSKAQAEAKARMKAEKESAAKKKKVEEEAAAKAKAKEEAAAKAKAAAKAAEEAAAKVKAAEEAAAKAKAAEQAAAKAAEEAAAKVKAAEEAAAKAKAAEEAAAKVKAEVGASLEKADDDGHSLEYGDDGAGAVKTPNEVQQTQGNRPWTIALGSMMVTAALRWLHGFQSEPSLTIRHW